MNPPEPVRRAVVLNLFVAATMVCLLATGSLIFERDLYQSWQVVVGFAAWLAGTAGLWWGRRWGWYLTLLTATIFSVLAVLVGNLLFFFHGGATL